MYYNGKVGGIAPENISQSPSTNELSKCKAVEQVSLPVLQLPDGGPQFTTSTPSTAWMTNGKVYQTKFLADNCTSQTTPFPLHIHHWLSHICTDITVTTPKDVCEPQPNNLHVFLVHDKKETDKIVCLYKTPTDRQNFFSSFSFAPFSKKNT